MREPDPRRDVRNWGVFVGVLVVVTIYYEVGNIVWAPSFAVAHAHALDLWHLQQTLGLAWEPAIQAAVDNVQVAGIPWLMVLLILFYVGPHFVLTFAFLGWAYWNRFERFAQVRNVFAAFTVISFGFQWAYPLAPPRLVPETGLRYTLDEWLPVTGDSPAIMTLTNPYAAFPSVHTGWALLVAFFAVRLTSSPWRHLWWAYPGAIVLSILATGNHFLLDPVASVPFIMVAFGIDRVLRRRAREPAPSLPPVVHAGGHPGLARRAQRMGGLGARPRSLQHPRNWVAGARLFIDYALTVPPRVNRVASKIRHYPAPFTKHTVTMPDGARIRLWLGTQKGRRPALLIIPGLYTSKDNAVVKRRALRIFHQWGFHVMTVDLRGNGESDRVPSTAGWKEADDLLHLVDWLRAKADVDGVGVYAESLAATAAVLAAARAGETGRRFADRGVLAVSTFADVEDTLTLYSDPPADAPKALLDVVRFFSLLLRASGEKAKDFRAYHEAASRHYGVDPSQAAADSTLWRQVKRLNDPVLVLHSQDDMLVPVAQAHLLDPLARQVDGLGLWLLPWGHHCLYEMAEPEWFWRVLGAFFEADTGPVRARGRGLSTPTAVPSPTD